MNDIGLKPEQLCGITTDGAPSMVGRTKGVVSLMENVRQDEGATAKFSGPTASFAKTTCEAKSLKMQNVVSVVVNCRATGDDDQELQDCFL